MGQSTGNTMSTQGQITDSSKNLQYDLISTLYHACKSNTAIEQYIRDAQQLGNDEAAQFFQMVAQQDQQRAQRAGVAQPTWQCAGKFHYALMKRVG